MGSWNHSLYYTCGKVVEFSLVRMRTALQPTPKKARPAARVWVLIRAKRANPGTKGVGRYRWLRWWAIMGSPTGSRFNGKWATDSEAIQFISMFLVSNFIVDLQKCVKKYKRNRTIQEITSWKWFTAAAGAGEWLPCPVLSLFRCYAGKLSQSRASHPKWQ